jgi:tetratricopeptide (TPR) repeat protein
MLKELHQRQQREHEIQQQAALRSFRAAWPHIYQRLDALENQRPGMPVADYIRGRYMLARDMWDFGARRWAWFSFASIFEREGNALGAVEHIETGVELAKMMLQDDAPDHAVRVTQSVLGLADALPDSNPLKFAFWKLHATCLERVCDYKGAVEAFERAMKLAPDMPSRSELEAQLAELHCLQGEFGNALTSLSKGGTSR